jgi:hypothetical protein
VHEPFEEVVRRFAHLPGTVALVSGGKLDCARHHILGVYPWLSLSAQRTRTTLADGDHRVELDGDPFTILRRVMQHCSAPDLGSAELVASLPLTRGLLGYFAYDLKDCLEQLPRTTIDDLGCAHVPRGTSHHRDPRPGLQGDNALGDALPGRRRRVSQRCGALQGDARRSRVAS